MKEVTYGQLANVALQVMAKSSVQADDESLSYIQMTRSFLRDIAEGRLQIVATPAPKTPVRAPKAKPEKLDAS